jgi:hypothetical protein
VPGENSKHHASDAAGAVAVPVPKDGSAPNIIHLSNSGCARGARYRKASAAPTAPSRCSSLRGRCVMTLSGRYQDDSGFIGRERRLTCGPSRVSMGGAFALATLGIGLIGVIGHRTHRSHGVAGYCSSPPPDESYASFPRCCRARA